MTQEFLDKILTHHLITSTKNGNHVVNTPLLLSISKRCPNLVFYIQNRYPEPIVSMSEIVMRMFLKIEKRHVCPICGTYTTYRGYSFYVKTGSLYREYCDRCKYLSDIPKKHRKETCVKKFGGEAPMCSKKIQEKSKKTCLKKYGVEWSWQSDNNKKKSSMTCIEKYGSPTFAGTNEWKAKTTQTYIERYGVTHWAKSESGRQKIGEMTRSPETKKKIYISKKKNHSFNTSKPEKVLYQLLLSKYDDVKYQYKSKEYPWNCDFYIPSIDTYIELQGFYTHGDHPYIEDNEDDKARLEMLKEKCKA